MRYHVTGIFGDAEHGKTTWMVRNLLKEVESGEYYDEGYSNIHIGPDLIYDPILKKTVHGGHPKIKFLQYKDLISMKYPAPNGTPRVLVGLDQLHKYFYSRRSPSILNVKSNEVLIESRQHGFDVMGTTWARSAVDPQYRKFIQYYVGAQRVRNGFLYTPIDTSRGLIKRSRLMTWAEAKKVWRYFDSTELIEDPTIEEFVQGQRKKAAPQIQA